MEELNINLEILEEWQIERLEIFKNILKKIGNDFVLKGGTALLLYYGLDRFSEDIDLDSFTNNMDIYNKIKENNWNKNVKKNTDTVYRIMIDYGAKKDNGNYPLKVEISSRNKELLKTNALKYNNINGVNVYDLDEILKMKLIAFGNRDKIRDFYDLAFFLEKEPTYFTNEMLKELKIKMEYKDFDELSFLLNEEFKQNHLKKIDGEKLVLETYDKLEKMIISNNFNEKNNFLKKMISDCFFYGENNIIPSKLFFDNIKEGLEIQELLERNNVNTLYKKDLYKAIDYFFENIKHKELNLIFEELEYLNFDIDYLDHFKEKILKSVENKNNKYNQKSNNKIKKKKEYEIE